MIGQLEELALEHNSVESRKDSALIALRQILRATELNSRAIAKQSGLNPSQLILMNLIASQRRLMPSLAARQMSLSQATLTALASKLEERGLVTRERDDEDKRRVYLTLTPAGERILSETPDMLQEKFSHEFANLQSWEQASLVSALERVAGILGAEDMDCAAVLCTGDIQPDEAG